MYMYVVRAALPSPEFLRKWLLNLHLDECVLLRPHPLP